MHSHGLSTYCYLISFWQVYNTRLQLDKPIQLGVVSINNAQSQAPTIIFSSNRRYFCLKSVLLYVASSNVIRLRSCLQDVSNRASNAYIS